MVGAVGDCGDQLIDPGAEGVCMIFEISLAHGPNEGVWGSEDRGVLWPQGFEESRKPLTTVQGLLPL